MRLIDHPQAKLDLIEAVRFYESRESGLGSKFLSAITEAISRIEAAPERYSRLRGGIRRCQVADFPYTILYRLSPSETEIIAYMHGRRRPGYWRSRLTD